MDLLEPAAPDLAQTEALDPEHRRKVVAHYDRVAPLITAAFGAIPLISLFLPNGFHGDEIRVGRIRKPLPAAIPSVEVTTESGRFPYVALTAASMLWETHRYAFGFESWTPTPADPSRVAFAHINVSQRGKATLKMQREAAHLVHQAINAQGIDAFVTLDGPGIMLWLPFADAPTYPDVRLLIHGLDAQVAAASPDLFETKLDEPPNRIRITASSNARAKASASVLAARDPIAADESPDRVVRTRHAHVGRIRRQQRSRTPRRMRHPRIRNRPHRPATHRDLRQTRAAVRRFRASSRSPQPRFEVIMVALTILANGKPRLVEEIEEEAIERDLWPKNERREYV